MAYQYSTSMFIGETTDAVPQPVFFDLHTPVINSSLGGIVSTGPGCLITGAPGSGKTYLGLTLTTISAICGKTTVVLDPKGDFLYLANLADQIGKFNIWDLSKGNAGLLDPFYMATEASKRLNLVVAVIDILVGGLTNPQMTVLAPIVKDVAEERLPSLQRVVDELRGSEKAEARDLGTQLDLLRNLPFAKLCFAPGGRNRDAVRVDKGLTVINLMGLEYPKGDSPEGQEERLAAGVLFLLTDFLRRIMQDDDSPNPKTIVIDEAHAVLSSRYGADTVKQLALLGRSKYLSLVLITQNISHLEKLDIENTISTRFAFRSSRKEAEEIVDSMELPQKEGFEDIILNLQTGECLMKDFRKRYSKVMISSWREDWSKAFQTNPLERRKARAEQQKKAAAAAATKGS